MIVYRAGGEPIDPREELRSLAARARLLPRRLERETAVALFVDMAEIEGAIVDATFPQRDGISPLAEALGSATAAAARAVVACWRHGDAGAIAVELSSALARAQAAGVPGAAYRRVSEGYAYYALHPETYALAARRFARRVRPAAAVALGIRTIGSGLAAIVVAALQAHGVPARAWSVRPRGHPFDRMVSLSDDLAGVLRGQPAGTHFLVVDEGPGISGTSFASAAGALEGLGVPADRIHLFPSWMPDASALQSPRARDAWQRYRKWHAEGAEAGVGLSRLAAGEGCHEWSGGAWRRHFYPSEASWPAAMPSHERVKVFRPADGVLFRFAGLARYGEAKRARAEALAGEGLGVEPGALVDGYLRLGFVPGEPCAPADAGSELLRRVAAQISFVARAFPARRSPSLDDLQHMIETNAQEAAPSIVVPPLAAWGAALGDAQAAAIDGRMQAHEWIRTRGGYMKTDALDHSSDHFFPGAQDAAWDVAAAEAEFRLSASGTTALIDEYVRLSADRGIRMRLPFYRLAYAASALGYADFAAQSLRGSPEAARFAMRRGFFLARVRELAERGAVVSSQ